MNDRAKRYLMEQMRGDGRNPYGSRGGYVTSRDPRRRDRGEYDERDMDYRYERDNGYGYMSHERYPHEELRGDFEYTRQYRDGNRPNEIRGDYRGGGRGERDYGDYGDYEEDYRGRRRNSRGQFMRDRGMDYGDDKDMRLSKEQVEMWEREMENNDGTRGFHFPKEQAEQVARQLGFDPKMLGDDYSFWVAMNLEYSDGCITARKYGVDRPDYFADLAIEKLTKDKDYKGKGAEKLFLYYTFIADDEK